MRRFNQVLVLLLTLCLGSTVAYARGGDGNGAGGNGNGSGPGNGGGMGGGQGSGNGSGPGHGDGTDSSTIGSDSDAGDASKAKGRTPGTEFGESRIAQLQALLQRVQQDYNGRILAVELETEQHENQSRPVYEVKLLTSTGSVLKLWYDAIDMQLLEIKGQQGIH